MPANAKDEEWDYLVVTVPERSEPYLVPVKFNYQTMQNTIGELPPEVAEFYEVKIIPTPWLVRKADAPQNTEQNHANQE